MKNKSLSAIIIFAGFCLLAPVSQAHQPVVALNETKIVVTEPEISKAFYGELQGQPNFFTLHSDAPFNLYVNILVPNVPDVKKNISFEIRKDGQLLSAPDRANFEWQNFYEPFAGDNYFQGPEFQIQAQPGDYEIKVFSPNNLGKYSLAIGETESFPASTVWQAVITIPQIKKDFFGYSIFAAYLNQTMLLFIGIIIAISGIIWLLAWKCCKNKKLKK